MNVEQLNLLKSALDTDYLKRKSNYNNVFISPAHNLEFHFSTKYKTCSVISIKDNKKFKLIDLESANALENIQFAVSQLQDRSSIFKKEIPPSKQSSNEDPDSEEFLVQKVTHINNLFNDVTSHLNSEEINTTVPEELLYKFNIQKSNLSEAKKIIYSINSQMTEHIDIIPKIVYKSMEENVKKVKLLYQMEKSKYTQLGDIYIKAVTKMISESLDNLLIEKEPEKEALTI